MVEFIRVQREKERREHQHLSLIAFRQAELTATWMWKRKDMNVAEVFPYWTDEEKNAYKVEKYKNIMYKYVNSTKINN